MGQNSSQSLRNAEWLWQTNENPFSETEPPTWDHYSDVENMIIEEAFIKKKPKVILDECYIEFKSGVQVSLADENKRHPVKRIERRRQDKCLRQQRFYDFPADDGRSFAGQYGWISPFIVEVRRHLGLGDGRLPSKNPELVSNIVQKAAQGMIDEGKSIGKEQEGIYLAKLLLEKKDAGMKEVWKRCAYLYSMECFLYKSMNTTMRMIGNKERENLWLSKVPTLGPFCLLLWDDPLNDKLKFDKTLYRGADLKPEHIEKYKEMAGDENRWGSFPSFCSTSRNREKSEGFGNTLFIMKVNYAFIADLTQLSQYEDEEEELITPGVCFRVERVEHDDKTNKHLVYLELRQRFDRELYI